MSLNNLHRPLVLGLMLAGLSSSVLAVDGIILIDQNRALAGGVTPGDFPGFPISITQPGSYRLSSNITVAAQDLSAIEISASDVTLDLNGFHIVGPAAVCVNPIPAACVQASGVAAVPFATAYKSIKVRGGTITGFGAQLSLFSTTLGVVEDLVLIRQPGGNISFANAVGARFVVKNMISADSFDLTCPTIVVESIATFFLRQVVNTGCVFSNSVGTVI